MVQRDWGESRLKVAALGEKRIGELRDQTDNIGVAGGGVFGEKGAVGSFVGVDELLGHGEGHGVVVMGVENDETGVFQAGDTFAVWKIGPNERSEAAEERMERGAIRHAGVSGGGNKDGEVVPRQCTENPSNP